jgi:F-type H+-transporting ATPase subunit b
MRTRRSLAALALVVVTFVAGTGVSYGVAGGGGGGEGEAEGGGQVNHAAEQCIHLLEGGGEIDDCQEAPNPILPEINELIWGALSFAVLFALLAKLALPGIRQSMQARSDKIRSSLDEAERSRAEAQAILADYQRQLAEAKGEAGRIIDDARQTAESVKRDLMARAEAEAEEQRRRNAEQIAAERNRVMTELQGQVAVLAVEMAERVVEANLDRDASLRLIENYINTVGGNGAGSAGARPVSGAR